MHVPDGLIDTPVSIAAGAVAVSAVAVALRGARRELEERTAPLAGLVAAFVFSMQMLTFPIGAGTSGHLMGGALAAILVGPYTGILVLSVVLLIQALLFADGGLSALGLNITLLGVTAVLVSWLVFRALVTVLPRARRSVTGAAFAAALVSVPAAASAFVGLYALGGTADVPLGTVLTAMVGVHTAIGVGEGVITALTIGAVLAVRPDLVHGARGLTAPLTLRAGAASTVPGAPASAEQPPVARKKATEASAPASAPARRPMNCVWLAGLAVTTVCAGLISGYASERPDGLERVAGDHGLDAAEREHQLADSPLSDYAVDGVDDDGLSVGLAGVLGAGMTLAVGSVVFVIIRRRTDNPGDSTGTDKTTGSTPDQNGA